jgi:RNA methyltransferase, TrmH family
MSEPFTTISSLQNPRLKNLVRLREARHRRRSGFFLIEGERELGRALKAGWKVQDLFFCPEHFSSPAAMDVVEAALARNADAVQLSSEAFAKVAFREHPDGLLGLAPIGEKPLESFVPGSPALILVVDGVEKPGNLGALMRTANAAGVDAMLLCDPVCDRYNPNVIRASQGAFFDLPVFSCPAEEAREWLARHGITVLATTPGADALLWDHDLRGPLALVLGAEDTGLGPDWLEGAGMRTARLPMCGLTDSLNVSVTAGVALFEVVRQRRS